MSILAELLNIGYSEFKDDEVKKQNRDLAKQYDKQIFMLTKSIEGIEEFSEGLVEMEREGSELRSQDMFSSFLRESEDISEDYERNIMGADMAYSGTVEEETRRERETLAKGLELGQTGESLRRERNLLDILTSKEDSLSSVRNQIYSLETSKLGLRQ